MTKDTTETTKKAAKTASKTAVKKTASSTKNIEQKETEKNISKATKKVSPKKKIDLEKNKTKKVTSTKQNINKTKNNKKNSINKNIPEVEYYDLPYRYNQTTVKILAQTPTTLFVYWDISDKDIDKYKKDFGEDFFNNSKPFLIIYNKTKQTTYEVEINDFANSWYLKMIEPNCKYEIELGRKIINANKLNINTKENSLFPMNIYDNYYIPITNSNSLETPNNHILLENIHIDTKIEFKNVKTNEVTIKNFGTLTFMPNIHKLFNFYKTIYKNEIIEDNNKTILNNPSSSSFFK